MVRARKKSSAANVNQGQPMQSRGRDEKGERELGGYQAQSQETSREEGKKRRTTPEKKEGCRCDGKSKLMFLCPEKTQR